MEYMNIEQQRLRDETWKKWGPYVSDRQWGTIREDYSANGDAWQSTTHDMARSKAWRWGEEGIGGISDDNQYLCFALALWNKKDPIIKERYFGLSNNEGNHGEDVKELYYYLDSTPTHSYMKMLYKYPQAEYPYQQLLDENRRRTRLDAEYEIIDTGIFNNNKYYDVFIEYAKASANDILVKITVHNRGNEDADLHILPTLWYRNRWAWGLNDYKPRLSSTNKGDILAEHKELGNYTLHLENKTPLLFCDNETNNKRLYNTGNTTPYTKDGINNFLVHGDTSAININAHGTKAAVNYDVTIPAGGSITLKLRLEGNNNKQPFADFDTLFETRKQEADAFYNELQKDITSEEEKLVQRQAFAGMLWSKQFYNYNVQQWLDGDPAQPPPPPERKHGRNHAWPHLHNHDVISMPDKWEYPWYAAWDLAFQCIALAMVDVGFAKNQLQVLTREWYMHPNGQLPAYEWNFSDVNPPVHAWGAWRVYEIDKKMNGSGDIPFLESVYHKLLLNFTWWVNRKDAEGNNIFEGGFLGLDNVGVFDRNAKLPDGGLIQQADGTSWMAMYSLNMMRISLELAMHNPVYQDMATKFFEHFLYIAGAMANMGGSDNGLWDDEDSFFYDALWFPGGASQKLKVRSVVGIIPLFAVEVLGKEILEALPQFAERLTWFLNNKPSLANLVSRWQEPGGGESHLLSLLRGHRMKKILVRMLDSHEFLSEYGIRSLSKYHQQNPYQLWAGGQKFSVEYTPGESTSGMFGGNSNWRGPVWMPVNFLMVESLQRFHYYYGDDFKVECPTGSGQYLTLNEVAQFITDRLSKLFLTNQNNERPALAALGSLQHNEHFRPYMLFHEYFHGDTGKGLGSSHQTGWTGLIAKLLQPRV